MSGRLNMQRIIELEAANGGNDSERVARKPERHREVNQFRVAPAYQLTLRSHPPCRAAPGALDHAYPNHMAQAFRPSDTGCSGHAVGGGRSDDLYTGRVGHQSK
jgi:hypothetical protein